MIREVFALHWYVIQWVIPLWSVFTKSCHTRSSKVLQALPLVKPLVQSMDAKQFDPSKMHVMRHVNPQEPRERIYKRNVTLCAMGQFPWGYVDEVGLLDSDFSAYNQIHAMLHDSNQCDQHVRPSRRRQTAKIIGYMGQLATGSWREPCFKDQGFSVWVVHVFVWVCETLCWSWFCAACMCKPTKEPFITLFIRLLICRNSCIRRGLGVPTSSLGVKKRKLSHRQKEPCLWYTVVMLVCSLGAAEQSNSSSIHTQSILG